MYADHLCIPQKYPQHYKHPIDEWESIINGVFVLIDYVIGRRLEIMLL